MYYRPLHVTHNDCSIYLNKLHILKRNIDVHEIKTQEQYVTPAFAADSFLSISTFPALITTNGVDTLRVLWTDVLQLRAFVCVHSIYWLLRLFDIKIASRAA